jgi:hypothetical protein
MQSIEGLLLDPVGCLAEFPSGPFHEIAVRLFGRKGKASPSGSRSYWHLLNLMEAAETPLKGERRKIAEALEAEAVAAARPPPNPEPQARVERQRCLDIDDRKDGRYLPEDCHGRSLATGPGGVCCARWIRSPRARGQSDRATRGAAAQHVGV